MKIPLSKLYFYLKRLSKHLSVKAGAFAILGILVTFVSSKLSFLVPEEWAQKLSEESVNELLKILASSMLLVVTFSLSTMVAAFASASQSVTPRAAMLLREDHSSQNVISIFLGSFIFSIVSLIALYTNYYSKNAKIILFIFTILLIILIVYTIINWIDRLSRLGRVHETIKRVEEATNSALIKSRENSCQTYSDLPSDFFEIYKGECNYLVSIGLESLQEIAVKNDIKIYLTCTQGTFISKDKALAVISDKVENEILNEIKSCFILNSSRLFDEDLRFGLITLSEISSRALSPAVNDPGTAIDIIGSMLRFFTGFSESLKGQADIKFNRIFRKEFQVEDLFNDLVNPIAKYGAAHTEVVIRLYKALDAIKKLGNKKLEVEAVKYQRILKQRADQALNFTDEKIKIKKFET